MIRPTPVRHDGTTCTEFDFFFKTNIQGDVLAVYNASGTEVMKITYDAWGNFTDTVSTMSYPPSTEQLQALAIPFRYRGYVYDQETGFYYLNSRYYDPVMHKFLNADGLISTGQGLLGNNMYAYCNNNPVMYVDPTGEVGWLAIALVVVVAAVVLTSCSSEPTPDVGAAEEYVYSDSTDYNCYAHAIGETEWKCVGGSPDAVKDFDVDNVAEMVLSDAQKDGRTMRIIDSYDSPIASNEYRIALRTGDADYHFMVQHNDGSWSHKPGICSTRLINGANPSVVSWDAPKIDPYFYYYYGIVKEVGSEANYYDSKTIYFAVTK